MISLVNYSSSESDSSNSNSPPKDISVKKKTKAPKPSDEVPLLLPLPKSIEEMFSDEPHSSKQDTCQGRIRSFPHVRGNWATFVFLKYKHPENVVACTKMFHQRLPILLSQCEPSVKWPEFHLFSSTELHISLSRTVPIQFHLIEPLVSALRAQLKQVSRFTASLRDISYYTNDEEMRSFIGLDVQEGSKELSLLVDHVDGVFEKFGLPVFYQERSFHISLVWCLENLLIHLTSLIKRNLQDLWLKCQEQSMEYHSSFQVSLVHLKTGNKTFTFHLQDNTIDKNNS